MNHLTHPLSSANISIFSPVISKFSSVFKDCFNKHGCNFDDVSKIGHTSPSQNKRFLKSYDVIIFIHDVSIKTLLRDSNCIVDVVM